MPRPANFALRPAAADDQAFLFRLYASTREEELAPLGWTTAQRDAFLRQQFTAQRSHYRTAFPDATVRLVLRGPQPVGALILHRTASELRIVDLALLPAHRGAGLGTQLLLDVMAQARDAHLPLRLQVLKSNRAVQWYGRVGFMPTGENGLYLKMEWRG